MDLLGKRNVFLQKDTGGREIADGFDNCITETYFIQYERNRTVSNSILYVPFKSFV